MAKKKTKKKNPQVQVRESDMKRMKNELVHKAMEYAYIVMLNVLRDYFGFGPQRLKRAFDGITTLSEEICDGRISFFDLKKVLEDEANIVIELGGKRV